MVVKIDQPGHISYQKWIEFPEQKEMIEWLEEEFVTSPTCERCEGSGDCECSDCGHVHPCPDCDGTGKTDVGEEINMMMVNKYLEECKKYDWLWLRWARMAIVPQPRLEVHDVLE